MSIQRPAKWVLHGRIVIREGQYFIDFRFIFLYYKY